MRRRFALVGLLVVVGVVIVVVGGGGTVSIIGAGLIGVGAVLAVALVFFEVGLSEDRARDAEARRRRRR